MTLAYKSKPYDDDSAEVTSATNAPASTLGEVQSKAVPKPKSSRVVSSSTENRVLTVNTLDELKNALNFNNQKGRIVIVRFFSHQCKSCQAVTPKYMRLARLNPHVRFIDVAITKETTDIQEEMNVVAVPFGQIYLPTAGLVEELRMSKSYWSDFEDIFYSYVNGKCDLVECNCENPLGKVREVSL